MNDNELNQDTISELRRIFNDQMMTVRRLKDEAELAQRHANAVNAIIVNNCKHVMEIDSSCYEPCGPRPKVCRKCGYWTR